MTSNRACSLVVPLEAQKRLGRIWCKNISNSQCPNVNHGLRPHHIANKSAKSSVCFDIQGPKGCVLRRFMLEEKRNMYIHTCTAALMLAMSKRKPFQQSFSPAVKVGPSSVRSSMGGTMSKFKRLFCVNFDMFCSKMF